MEGPPLGPGGDDITWPDQVAPWGRKASTTRKIKPQTSNLFSSGLVPEATEAQRRAIARYDPPGGTSVDDSSHHMLRLGDFAWELRNHRLEQLLREPLSAAARVHRWLTAAEGSCPPLSPTPWQGL